MKFYSENKKYYDRKIELLKLTAIYCCYNKTTLCVIFFKNGLPHNSKDGAYIDDNRYKAFYLNGKYYGNENSFTKELWRKFVKLQAFL